MCLDLVATAPLSLLSLSPEFLLNFGIHLGFFFDSAHPLSAHRVMLPHFWQEANKVLLGLE